jgi:4-hydroxy-3-methylbut-2-enyl diphosphate reductase
MAGGMAAALRHDARGGAMRRPPLLLLLARARGFCAGVERAIGAVEATLERAQRPVHVRHQIVHNGRVVDQLAARGARFVEELDGVPEGGVVVFSAHGVGRVVERVAAERGLQVVDATCPLVRRVHHEVRRQAREGREIVVVGHRGHVEIEGILGRIDGPAHAVASVAEVARLEPGDAERLAYVVQTTLSVDDAREVIAALKARFPRIQGPDTRTICYATQNRQAAVRLLALRAERVIVCGARNSSNTTRLKEVAEAAGRPALLIERAQELTRACVLDVACLGLTAGASTPESIVQETIARIGRWRALRLEEVGPAELSPRFSPVNLDALDPAPVA